MLSFHLHIRNGFSESDKRTLCFNVLTVCRQLFFLQLAKSCSAIERYASNKMGVENIKDNCILSIASQP